MKDIVQRLRDCADHDVSETARDGTLEASDLRAWGDLMEEAANEIALLRITLNQSLGIIVEFGGLNGFRNMSNAELGKAVVGMAERVAEVLPKPVERTP